MSSTVSTIATFQTTLSGRKAVASITAEIAKTNNEISTGFYNDVYAQLGMRSSQTIALRASMSALEAYTTTNTLLDGKLETMEASMNTIDDALQSVLALATTNASSATQTATTLQAQAKAALDVVISALNTTYAGEYLFSGTSTETAPMQVLNKTNASTGLSPDDVVSSIVGSGPTDAADAATMIAALEAIFASTPEGTAENYEETFYNGTALSTGGTTNARMQAQIADGQTLSYGVQANDPAFTQIIQGLMMLSTVDVSTITDEGAYSAYMDEVVSLLSSGNTALDSVQTTVGSNRALLASAIERQTDLQDIYNNRVVALEGVDSYEAATRLSALQTQLEATYSITAQISNMSILNYL